MSSFAKFSALPSHAEIANLEHELAVLKERRANLYRFATMALRGFAAKAIAVREERLAELKAHQ